MHHLSKVAGAVFAGVLALAGSSEAALGAPRAASEPPSFSVAVAGVGLPSRISLTSEAAGVTSFDYAVAGGRAAAVPAKDGAAAGNIVFPAAGPADVTARAYAGRRLVGESTQTVDVSDVPGVSSDEFLNPDVTPLVGTTGTFTFTPHARGVVKYYWWINDGGAQEVRARHDGTAKVSWTPPADVSAKYELFVQSVTAAGAQSARYDEWVRIQDPRPGIEPAAGTHEVGEPVAVTLSNGASQATGFVYSFDGGPQQSVSGAAVTVQVTPSHAGDALFTAQTVLAGGTRSKAVTATVTVTDMPQVSVVSAYGQTQPVATEPTTFTFTPKVPNVVSYQYTVDGDGPHPVAAGPDGTASITVIPDTGQHSLTVSSVDAAGVVSDARDYEYTSLDPRIEVFAEFGDGAGEWGFFSVLNDLSPVTVAYHWSVDGGPEHVTPVDPNSGGVTDLEYRPALSGTGTVQVQAEYNDGTLSAPAGITFEVG
ncbi:hypothetical protein [Actinoplanes sp. NPDC051411]|uniref:hypothetical protein n=1 Tax=Actinoplanes sp. NPDC051411 TaxID=3155522 RepID=UPI00343B227C